MKDLLELPKSLRQVRRLEFPRKLGILEKLYGKSLEKLGKGWVRCSNNVVWKLNLVDPCHRWIVYGKYEGGDGIDFARTKLENGGVYLDSGANIGQWLLFIASMGNVNSLAFEPVSTERAWLDECLKAQEGWNVSILPFGLGSAAKEIEIQMDGPRSTLNLDWYQGKNFQREKIQLRRLEEVLNELGVEKVNFWKLDVEGAELEALHGAVSLLSSKNIDYIYFECHPDNYIDIRELLNKYDYGIYDLVKGNLVTKKEEKIFATQDLIAAVKE